VSHQKFQDRLNRLVTESKVGQEVFGEILARAARQAPDDTTRVHIGEADPSARRSVDQRQIPQATVSKAVTALLRVGLLEEGKNPIRSVDGRPLSSLRLGRRFVIAGVDIQLCKRTPKYVTTALIGLDSTRVLTNRRDEVPDKGPDRWESAAQLVRRQLDLLLEDLNKARELVDEDLTEFEVFGIGVEIGAPVKSGEVMLVRSVNEETIDFASKLRSALSEKNSRPTGPVLIENDVNALAVLAAREAHYTHADLVAVSVFDGGVGGGLVMDGRLRRGGNGRAMEIGHMPMSVPGDKVNPWGRSTRPKSARLPEDLDDFDDPCWCGETLHVDTFAPPGRIRGQLQPLGVDYKTAANSPVNDPSGKITEEGEIFRQAGSALGRAAAHVCNIVNPSSLIIYVPAEFDRPVDEEAANRFDTTAAGAYHQAARSEITSAFANKDQLPERYLEFRPLPSDTKEIAVLLARAAAACVFESFIEHALKTDGCQPDGRNRPSTAA
jgi:predicted NBD/HSP70 family sugar kinase